MAKTHRPPTRTGAPNAKTEPPRRQSLHKKIVFLSLGAGALTGLLGSFFGSGGGIVAVFALRRLFPEDAPRDIFASALCIILPMSALSAAVYGFRQGIPWQEALQFLPPSLLGGLAGAWLAGKLKGTALHRIFALLLIFAGGALLFRG